jgi:hypothetical protein
MGWHLSPERDGILTSADLSMEVSNSCMPTVAPHGEWAALWRGLATNSSGTASSKAALNSGNTPRLG